MGFGVDQKGTRLLVELNRAAIFNRQTQDPIYIG